MWYESELDKILFTSRNNSFLCNNFSTSKWHGVDKVKRERGRESERAKCEWVQVAFCSSFPFISKQVNLCSMPNYGINSTLQTFNVVLRFISKTLAIIHLFHTYARWRTTTRAERARDTHMNFQLEKLFFEHTLVVINLFVIGKYVVDMLAWDIRFK